MKILDRCACVGKETPDGVLSIGSTDEEEVGRPGLEGRGQQREILFGVRACLGLRPSCLGLDLEVGQGQNLQRVSLVVRARQWFPSPGLLHGS